MTVFNFLLFSTSLAWVISTPEEGSLVNWAKESSEGIYKDWASESAARLQISSIACLLVGCPTSLFVICLLLFQNKFVKKVVDDYKQEEDVRDQLHNEEDPATKECHVKTEVKNAQMKEGDNEEVYSANKECNVKTEVDNVQIEEEEDHIDLGNTE